jgi:hypothetical protein
LVDLEWVSGVTDEPSLLLQNGRGGRQQYGIRPAEPSGFGGAGRGDAVVDVPLDSMGVRCRTRMLATFELPVQNWWIFLSPLSELATYDDCFCFGSNVQVQPRSTRMGTKSIPTFLNTCPRPHGILTPISR